MKTVISALVALVVGAGAMYFYQQGSMSELRTARATLETQLTEAKGAAEASAGELAKLQEAGKSVAAELDAAKAELAKAMDQKNQEVTALQTKLTELEAALAAAKSGTAQ